MRWLRRRPFGGAHNPPGGNIARLPPAAAGNFWKLPLGRRSIGPSAALGAAWAAQTRQTVPARCKHRARHRCGRESTLAPSLPLHTTYLPLAYYTIPHSANPSPDRLTLRRPCARGVRAQRRDAVRARIGARAHSGACVSAHVRIAMAMAMAAHPSAHSYCHTTSNRASVAHARFGREPARSVARLFASNGALHPSATFATSAPGPRAHICAGTPSAPSAIIARAGDWAAEANSRARAAGPAQGWMHPLWPCRAARVVCATSPPVSGRLVSWLSLAFACGNSSPQTAAGQPIVHACIARNACGALRLYVPTIGCVDARRFPSPGAAAHAAASGPAGRVGWARQL